MSEPMRITSRKNSVIAHFRRLASDGSYRRESGEYVCDGEKQLEEAVRFGASVSAVLFSASLLAEPEGASLYEAPPELVGWASPLTNSPGPVFTVRIPEPDAEAPLSRVIVLDGVQDPGNVGTVLRCAGAFGTDAVVTVNGCADVYGPKAARAAMGALFRRRVIATDIPGLQALLKKNDLPLYGAALYGSPSDVRDTELSKSAVAVGSEGAGLSRELLSICDGSVLIPMEPDCESLNAAVAASILMWEMARKQR